MAIVCIAIALEVLQERYKHWIALEGPDNYNFKGLQIQIFGNPEDETVIINNEKMEFFFISKPFYAKLKACKIRMS
jgi:hypothetical protein